MAEKFLMPKLSPTMEEGQISRWVKNEGDKFEANETLAEVDTDKATMEMTALNGGTLLKIIKGEGETAALGEPIAIIGKESSSSPTKMRKSGPNSVRHSVTKPRSFAACFIPTNVGDRSFSTLNVSSVIETAVRPGM